MRKYNRLILFSVLIYAVISAGIGLALAKGQEEQGAYYKVGINRLMHQIGSVEDLQRIDMGGYNGIWSVSYLSASERDRDAVIDFYTGKNGLACAVFPLMTGEGIQGYLRFDYQTQSNSIQCLFWVEGALFLMELSLLAVLLYLKRHLIQPFHRMQDMTHELSKGNLQGEVKAVKSQYLGKFLWSLGVLKDELDTSRRQELELQREKKMLLLSLSHDIKTPLNMIKLYGKALEDGMYPTVAGQRDVYRRIGEKALQIENFVGEIVKASREDIVHIEIEKGEFYLKELVQRIEAVYGEQCALRKCSLVIGAYQNRIFQGDFNRLFEVFENLFANAFKYGDGRQVRISFYEEDYCQLIRVFNTGESVAGKEFVHLFDSFFRGENTRGQQGNGLGLYICREIMHQMGGEIFAECGADGMAFVVVLPI